MSGAPASLSASAPSSEASFASGTAEFRITVASTESAVTSIIEIVRRAMETLNLGADWISRSELALQEALLNSHLHGNCANAAKEIRVGCILSEADVELSVEDDGPGYHFEHPVCNIDTAATSGRGLFLIRHMMDSVTFNESGSGIVMSLFKEPDHGNQRDRG